MFDTEQKWALLVDLLSGIQTELQSLNANMQQQKSKRAQHGHIYVPFKGSEIYLLHKAFVDSGGTPYENYKTLLEKTVPILSNKTQKGFSPDSFCKYSDKVVPESKENVKRFLLKMIRNIDSYD